MSEKPCIDPAEPVKTEPPARSVTLPETCPRWHKCEASVCPLAPHQGAHLPGERVCYYLRMSGKAGAAERFADDPVFALCLEALPRVVADWPAIGRAVEAAA